LTKKNNFIKAHLNILNKKIHIFLDLKYPKSEHLRHQKHQLLNTKYIDSKISRLTKRISTKELIKFYTFEYEADSKKPGFTVIIGQVNVKSN